MNNEIKQELQHLEEKHKIKILYAVESGSRAWGFASQNSDWDVRFIYIHHYDWYLSVDEKKDNIELILPSDIDLAGWEIRKALLLYKKSNPPIMEWLSSPIVYKEEYGFAEKLRENRQIYFNARSCIYHYLLMAHRNYTAYFKEGVVRIKKYFYVLRPILACCWIERTGTMAPMEFATLLEAEKPGMALSAEIEHLLHRKMSGEELDKEERIPVLDQYLEEKMEHFKMILKEFDHNNHPTNNELNHIFRSTLIDVWGNN